MKLFGKHRICASFYHIGALIFLGFTFLTYINVISIEVGFVLTSILFVVDYIAEMFDPNPKNPKTWFQKYFHRVYDDKEE